MQTLFAELPTQLAPRRADGVLLVADYRHPDGTGYQRGEINGWAVFREWAREIETFDRETGRFTYRGAPKAGRWLYEVTGFSNRTDWPEKAGFDGNCGHTLRADDTTQPVRMYGRKLFVTPTGTEDWHH